MNIKTENVALPMSIFSGFYNSVWDCEIGSEIERFCEDNDCTSNDINYTLDSVGTMKSIGTEYESVIPSNFEEYGILSCHYTGSYSPKEYNFSTDELFFTFEVNIYKMFRTIVEHKEKFKEILKNRHKSRSGFCSFYEWELSYIPCKELYSAVYLSDYLELCEYLHSGEEESPDFYHTSESEVYDYVTGNGGMCIQMEVSK